MSQEEPDWKEVATTLYQILREKIGMGCLTIRQVVYLERVFAGSEIEEDEECHAERTVKLDPGKERKSGE